MSAKRKDWAASSKRYRSRLMKRGLCIAGCGKRGETGAGLCNRCAAKYRERSRIINNAAYHRRNPNARHYRPRKAKV